MSRLNELRMIARVAQMYYVEGQRQAAIANHLRMSQATVSRMLKKAQEEEIVRTTVVPPSGTYSELETALRDQFGLTEAIVVECSEDRDGAIMARIGEAAAHFLVSIRDGIHAPLQLAVEVSDDGENYRSFGKEDNLKGSEQRPDYYLQLTARSKPRKARFVRFRIKSPLTIPEGFLFSGTSAWVFVDEVLVR